MAQVLVIGQAEDRLEELVALLKAQGYAASIAEDVTMPAPDAVILDLASAEGPGFGVLQGLKAAGQGRPPVVMTLIAEEDIGQATTLGVDDFVVVPFRPAEVATRLRLALSRSQGPEREGMLRFGDLVIDTVAYEVTLNRRPVNLTYMEYELLRFLAQHPGRVFSREALLSRVWGYDYYGGSRTVDVHIRRLRSKIEDASYTFIETVRNVGYRFRRDV